MFAMLACSHALAVTLTVDDLGDSIDAADGRVTLREAILAANGDTTTDLGQTGNGADVIDLTGVSGTIVLGSALPAIASDITIRGADRTTLRIQGSQNGDASDDGIFFIVANGALTLENVTLTGGMSRGGRGGDVQRDGAGGGAAGLGGAVLVSGGTLVASGVDFANNVATGGDGGSSNGPFGVYGAGGGGGFGADAPNYPANDFGGDGGNGGVFGNNGGGGGTAGFGGAGGNGGDGGGGGGGGTGIATRAGNGGFAGGGGGAGWAYCSAGPAGVGGFGGGGGGGTICDTGGYVLAKGAIGGAFGGKGGDGLSGPAGGGGGGGAGLGGAVFVRSGASATLVNCRFIGNIAQRGSGGAAGNYNGVPGNAGSDGQGKGGAIFAMDGASVSGVGVQFVGNSADNAGATGADNADVFGSIILTQGEAIGFARGNVPVRAASTTLPVAVRVVTSDSSPTAVDANVDYATADGSAHGGTDYVAASGVLHIPAGTASGTQFEIDVTILDSGTIEPSRAFALNLSNFVGAYADAIVSTQVILSATDTIFSDSFETSL